MAVDTGMIALIWCGSGPQGGWVAPPGGKKRAIGTNPIAVGIPAGQTKPLILDISTSVCAAAKIIQYAREGRPVPEGWLLDDAGNPTTDPNTLYQKGEKTAGALLPMAGHKGFGLALAAEFLGNILTGYGPSYKSDYKEGDGVFIIVVDIARFMPFEEFTREVDGVIRYMKSTPRRDGTDEISIPGEIEYRAIEERKTKGIPIDDLLWREILGLAESLGIAV
jgi:LDH2 family malate/lactate/ureidoglycolate dehydrogenase